MTNGGQRPSPLMAYSSKGERSLDRKALLDAKNFLRAASIEGGEEILGKKHQIPRLHFGRGLSPPRVCHRTVQKLPYPKAIRDQKPSRMISNGCCLAAADVKACPFRAVCRAWSQLGLPKEGKEWDNARVLEEWGSMRTKLLAFGMGMHHRWARTPND